MRAGRGGEGGAEVGGGSAALVGLKAGIPPAAGVVRVPRIAGVRDGLPVTQDGQVLDVANVIWCTGFRPGFSWIELPVLGESGEPQHRAGVMATEPGLYFVGLHFLYAVSSQTLMGVSRDARRIARRIAAPRLAGVALPSHSASSSQRALITEAVEVK